MHRSLAMALMVVLGPGLSLAEPPPERSPRDARPPADMQETVEEISVRIPKLFFDSFDVRGALVRRQLSTPVRAAFERASTCGYKMRLGTATLSFSVLPDGGVVGNKVVASTKVLGRCLREQLSNLRLPLSKGTSSVEIRVRFVHPDTVEKPARARLSVPTRRGRVRMGKPKVSGGISGDIVRRYVRRRLARFRACYDRELVKNPRLAGTLRLNFHIGATGRVWSSSAFFVNTRVARCFELEIKRMRFPKLKSGRRTVADYSIRLAPLRPNPRARRR